MLLRVVGQIQVVRLRRIFRSKRIDLFDKWHYACAGSYDPDFFLVYLFQLSDLPVRESKPLCLPQHFEISRPRLLNQPLFHFDDVLDSVQKPFVDMTQGVDLIDRQVFPHRLCNCEDSFVRWPA